MKEKINELANNGKPSFWEVASSRSWKEHFIIYSSTFGIILYAVFLPEHWMEWVFIISLTAVMTIAYWCFMINYSRNNIQNEYIKLQQQQKELQQLEKELNEADIIRPSENQRQE